MVGKKKKGRKKSQLCEVTRALNGKAFEMEAAVAAVYFPFSPATPPPPASLPVLARHVPRSSLITFDSSPTIAHTCSRIPVSSSANSKLFAR